MGNGLKKMISLVDQLEDARSEAQIELQDACSNLRRQVAAASPGVKRIKRDVLVARNAMEKLRKCHVKYLKAKNLGLTSATAVNSMEVNDWCRDQNMRRFSLMLTGVLLKADVKLEELELTNCPGSSKELVGYLRCVIPLIIVIFIFQNKNHETWHCLLIP